MSNEIVFDHCLESLTLTHSHTHRQTDRQTDRSNNEWKEIVDHSTLSQHRDELKYHNPLALDTV